MIWISLDNWHSTVSVILGFILMAEHRLSVIARIFPVTKIWDGISKYISKKTPLKIMYSHPLSIFHNIFKRIDCNSCMHNKTEFLRDSVKFCIVKPFIKQFIVNNHWCILCTFNLLLTMRGLCLDRSKLRLHESTNSTD